MDSISESNFGPLIAYLVPGATVLLGFSPFSRLVQTWFASTAPTLGGFLYLTVASLAVVMAVSALRWVIVDTTHAWTGLKMAALDFTKLGGNAKSVPCRCVRCLRMRSFTNRDLPAPEAQNVFA